MRRQKIHPPEKPKILIFIVYRYLPPGAIPRFPNIESRQDRRKR